MARYMIFLVGVLVLLVGIFFSKLLVEEITSGEFHTHARPALGGYPQTHYRGSFDYNVAVTTHGIIGFGGALVGLGMVVSAIRKK